MPLPAKNDECSDAAKALLTAFARQRPIRSGSLIVSLFGDVIAPHGGSVWLGCIIDALDAFGINERLVRTSVSRLAKKNWIVAERIGRRSYYRLTDSGLRRFEDASRRIYSEPRRDWNGEWCLVLLDGVESACRDDIRRELGWLGFAAFSSSVLACPSHAFDAVETRLSTLEGGSDALLMDARPQTSSAVKLQQQVRDAWQLEELEVRYAAFLQQFQPAYLAAREQTGIDEEQAFYLRLLLIHEYRRILLRDPFLPNDLLPPDWHGAAAYQLCRNFYKILSHSAESYIVTKIENAYGPLPPADASFHRRFAESFDLKVVANI